MDITKVFALIIHKYLRGKLTTLALYSFSGIGCAPSWFEH